MKQFQKMSEAEMEIMNEVWDCGGPASSADIQRRLSAVRPWKTTTILTFLSRLCEKGLLRIEREGRANAYIPLVSKEEYKQAETRAFLNEVHHGSVRSFFAALAGGGMTAEEIEELKKWFETK